ncbi:MAG: glycosyltransferase family 4 protein [Candidatus Glassbacteria bacterium]
MRVLHVIDSSKRGGGQTHVRGLLLELSRLGFELHLAVPTDGNVFDGLEASGIIVHQAGISKFHAAHSLRELVRILRQVRPDILHLHGSVAGVWGRLASTFVRDVSVVYTYHGVHYLRYRVFPRTHLFYLADRALSRLSERVICVSDSDRDLVIRAGLKSPEKVSVIHNGIDTSDHLDAFSTDRVDSSLFSGSDRLVICVARLHRQKGHVYLLRAAVSILERHPNTAFLLVGDGPERRRLEKLSRKLRIEDHVHFLGERDDVPALLSISDLFVLPSLWEGLPISVLEAALHRVPMIVTEVPGVTEVLEDCVSAVFIRPRDHVDIADAVDRVFSGAVDTDTLTQNALQLVRGKHDTRRMAEKTVTLYREIMKERAGKRGGM